MRAMTFDAPRRVSVTALAAFAVALLCSVAPGVRAQTQSGAAASNDEPRPVAIHIVLSDLRREASQWFKDQTFPRSRSDYAQDKHWRVNNDELLTALGRNLHRERALDAYIKWQLLSFKPDYAQVTDPAVWQRLLSWLPPVVTQPEPSDPNGSDGGLSVGIGMSVGAQQAIISGLQPVVSRGVVAYKPTLGVVNSGSVMDSQGTVSADRRYVVATVRVATAELLHVRQVQVAAGNAPVLTFRNQFIEQLPAAGGVQFVAAMKDAMDRVVAGDPSYNTAVDRLVRAAHRVRTEPTVTALQRQIWSAQLEPLRHYQRLVAVSVGGQGDQIVVTRKPIQFPTNKLNQVQADLGTTNETPGQPSE